MKERTLQTIDDIKENVTWQMMAILWEEIVNCFEKWNERWDKCVRPQGEKFQKD